MKKSNPFYGRKFYITVKQPDQPPHGEGFFEELRQRGKLQVPYIFWKFWPTGWSY